MQVVEKAVEGLSRSYGVKVPATELDAALEARIAEILPTLNLKGFRPGKAPKAHVKRMYGKALMGEVVEKTLNETSQQVLTDHRLRVAATPDLKPVSDMAEVLAGHQDLAYDLEVELIPDFEPVDVSTLELTRLVYDPTEAELDEAVAELAEQNRAYAPKTGKAAAGDQLLIDFEGRVSGEPFEGGKSEDVLVVLGSGQFLPGFEDQLSGAKAGDTVKVSITFPDDYGAANLAGQAAEFDVTVKEVRAPKAASVDDEMATRLGMADLAALREALRGNLKGEYDRASRFKLKRALLDALDGRHDILLPPRMVEAEFEGIWLQVQEETSRGNGSPEDEGKSEEQLKADYRQIAERRVRLGLVLAEIGRRANVQVTEAELSNAMREQAMRYGDMAQQAFDQMRQSDQYRTQIQAPLYEEKVVDHVLGLAKVTDQAVDKDVLLKDDDLPDFHAHDHSGHGHDHAGHD
ncbi:MAG: trigger factor, partial [Caulobacteraceae bacterium]|nr:trigger factor [Caulobacteraceae bacterium]